jgi:Na+/H+ antiporter NhaD/arsenite permease-like protein
MLRLPLASLLLEDPSHSAIHSTGTGAAVLPMLLIGLTLAATFAAIAFEWLHKVVASLLGAALAVILALLFGVFDAHGYSTVHEFIGHDLGVLGVIVGTSILVTIASDSGLFHFIAVKLVKLTGGQPSKLLPAVMTATVGFVTFLTIAPGVLIMASLVLVISKALDDDPVPYILAVAIGANSGALMTFASGIPTLMIGTSANIPYVHFLIVSAPLAILSALLGFFVIKLLYRSRLVASGDMQLRAAKVASFDEWALVKDRRLFVRSAAILLLTIAGFATAQMFGVGLDFIAICGAVAALLFSGFSVEDAIKKVKWTIILFFVALFVLIGCVRETGLLDVLAGQIYGLSGGNMLLVLLMIIPFVFLTAGIVDNIPVAATMIPVVKTMIGKGLAAEPLWWGLIGACNLGGNPTPVGSIAAVIALHALEKERGIKIGWGEYLKVGGAVTVLQIGLVFAYIVMFYELGLFPSLGAQ